MNCISSPDCFCSDTNDLLNKISCLVFTWFQYLLYKFKRNNKSNLKSHPFKNMLTFASGYLAKFCNFYPQITLETVFSALKLTQIYWINVNIFFSWKLAIQSQIGFTASTHIPSLKEYPHNLQNMKVGRIQKFKFSIFLVNWEKFGSIA